MSLAKITQVTGRGVYVPGNDIDTDRIIPARFMKCVTFDGLGEFLFYDVRHTPEGVPCGHPIDKPEHKGATILLSEPTSAAAAPASTLRRRSTKPASAPSSPKTLLKSFLATAPRLASPA